MTRQYTDKALNIMNGVLSLLESGVDVSKITSSQIATAAGVGKGTIYEYFESKEEILAQTFIYTIKNQTYKLEQLLSEKIGFKEKNYAIFECMLDDTSGNSSLMLMFHALGGVLGLFKYIPKNCEGELIEIRNRLGAIVIDIIKDGIKEGVISSKNDPAYIEYVISCNMLALYKNSIKVPGENCFDIDNSKTKDYAYSMLIKSLN